MKIDEEFIKSRSVDELLSLLYEMYHPIYEKYRYLDISFDEFLNIVKIEIAFSQGDYPGDNYIKEMIKRIDHAYSNYASLKLSDSNYAKKVLHNFLIQNQEKEIETQLFDLSDFSNRFHYNMSPDVIESLLNEDDYFKSIVEKYFKSHKSVIVNGKIEDITSNELLITIIDSYCRMEDIEICENDDDLSEKEEKDIFTDPFKSYIKEISQYDLLTAEDEKRLGYLIREGDKDARDHLTNSNLRLVVSIARRYTGKGLPLMDLIQEGNIGLMTAVDRFDPDKGFRFSTYATWWIRQSVTRAIEDKGRSVRLPVHVIERINQLVDVRNQLTRKLKRFPTNEEIAKEMNIDVRTLEDLLIYQEEEVSLQTPVGEEEDSELLYFIPSKEEGPEDTSANSTLSETLFDVLRKAHLTKREIEILYLRKGIYDGEEKTLEEVGKIFHLTRERVRQIQDKALKKIIESEHADDLVYYMPDPQKALDKAKKIREDKYKCKSPKETKPVGDIFSKMIENAKKKKDIPKSFNSFYKEVQQLHQTKETIYSHFLDYTKEQVDSIIKLLTPYEKGILRLRYGEHYDKLVRGSLTPEQNSQFYRLVNKIKKHLKNSYSNDDLNALDRLIDRQEEKTSKITKEEFQIIRNYIHSSDFQELLRELYLEPNMKEIPNEEVRSLLNKCFHECRDFSEEFIDIVLRMASNGNNIINQKTYNKKKNG